jgi:hypothetical protein
MTIVPDKHLVKIEITSNLWIGDMNNYILQLISIHYVMPNL